VLSFSFGQGDHGEFPATTTLKRISAGRAFSRGRWYDNRQGDVIVDVPVSGLGPRRAGTSPKETSHGDDGSPLGNCSSGRFSPRQVSAILIRSKGCFDTARAGRSGPRQEVVKARRDVTTRLVFITDDYAFRISLGAENARARSSPPMAASPRFG